MKTTIAAVAAAAFVTAAGAAGKKDETEGTAPLPKQAGEIYQKTDKKAAQRPGQTVPAKPIAPAKGPRPEEKATKGEETAGTAPSTPAPAKAKP